MRCPAFNVCSSDLNSSPVVLLHLPVLYSSMEKGIWSHFRSWYHDVLFTTLVIVMGQAWCLSHTHSSIKTPYRAGFKCCLHVFEGRQVWSIAGNRVPWRWAGALYIFMRRVRYMVAEASKLPFLHYSILCNWITQHSSILQNMANGSSTLPHFNPLGEVSPHGPSQVILYEEKCSSNFMNCESLLLWRQEVGPEVQWAKHWNARIYVELWPS